MLSGEGFNATSMAGGIMAWNGLVATGAYNAGMFLLEGREAPGELIPLAWSLEEGSRVFYEAAAEKLKDGEPAEIFRTLMHAEEGHKEKIIEAARSMGIEAQEGGLKATGRMEEGASLDEALVWLKDKGRKPFEMLEASMQLETNSLDFYMKVHRKTEGEKAGEVIASVIREEKAHLRWLGRVLEGQAGKA